MNSPRPTPQPIPYPMLPDVGPNPFRSPDHQRQSGNAYRPRWVVAQPRLKPHEIPVIFPPFTIVTNPNPVPVRPPVTNPNPDGESLSEVTPSPAPAVRPSPALAHSGAHDLRPPRKNEKETKVKTVGYEVFHNIVSTVTEGFDLVDSLYAALPSQYKPRYNGTPYERKKVTMQEKMGALYHNWDKVNVPDAIKNIVMDQIEDRIYGELGKINARASARDRPFGNSRFGHMSRHKHATRNLNYRFNQPRS